MPEDPYHSLHLGIQTLVLEMQLLAADINLLSNRSPQASMMEFMYLNKRRVAKSSFRLFNRSSILLIFFSSNNLYINFHDTARKSPNLEVSLKMVFFNQAKCK